MMIQTIWRSWAGHSSIGPKGDDVQSTSRTNFWKGVSFGGGGVAVQSKMLGLFAGLGLTMVMLMLGLRSHAYFGKICSYMASQSRAQGSDLE